MLAWYSLIHTPPGSIDHALDEFARCIKDGGGLLLGFFVSDELTPFDHAVVTAYSWPIPLLAEKIEAAGFEVVYCESRVDRPGRTHGAISAIRRENCESDESAVSAQPAHRGH